MAWNNFFYIVFGAIVGSFLNVCIVRLPKDESVLFPRSHCRSCETPLPFYDLIPIVSYIWLWGQCRHCGQKIAAEYPIVEALTAILSWVVFDEFGLTAGGISYFFFISSLIVVTFIDLHHRIIPDTISIGGIILGFLLSFGLLGINYIESLLGILLGGGLLLLLAYIYFKATKREGMGGGDIKLAAMMGAFLGYKNIFVVLMVSSILGSLWGLSLVLLRKQNLKEAIPYGPFLAAAGIITLFYGEHILFFLGY